MTRGFEGGDGWDRFLISVRPHIATERRSNGIRERIFAQYPRRHGMLAASASRALFAYRGAGVAIGKIAFFFPRRKSARRGCISFFDGRTCVFAKD